LDEGNHPPGAGQPDNADCRNYFAIAMQAIINPSKLKIEFAIKPGARFVVPGFASESSGIFQLPILVKADL